MTTTQITLDGRTFEISKREHIPAGPIARPYTYYVATENGERVLYGHILRMSEVRAALKRLVAEQN